MQKRNHGFSLVEMLVVVAIIGILSAAAVPQYQKYIATSKSTAILKYGNDIRTEVTLCFQKLFRLTDCDIGKHGIRAAGLTEEYIFRYNIKNGNITILGDYKDQRNRRMNLVMKPSVSNEDKLVWAYSGRVCSPNFRGVDCSQLK